MDRLPLTPVSPAISSRVRGLFPVWAMGSGVINLHVLLKVGDLPLIILYGQSGGVRGISSNRDRGLSPVWGIGSGVINLHVLSKVGDLPSTFLPVVGGGGLGDQLQGQGIVSCLGNGKWSIKPTCAIKGWWFALDIHWRVGEGLRGSCLGEGTSISPVWEMGRGVINLCVILKVGDLPSTFIRDGGREVRG